MNKNKIEKLIGIKNFILDKVKQKTKIINDTEDGGIVCEVRDADVYAKGLINSDMVKYVENKQKAGNIIIGIVGANNITVGRLVDWVGMVKNCLIYCVLYKYSFLVFSVYLALTFMCFLKICLK